MHVLLFVAAHPDDDTFGVARSVALHRDDPDLRFVLVHATDGEAGEIAPDSGIGRDQLGEARRREDAESWRILGREPDRHIWLGLPDGGLDAIPTGVLADRLATILGEERPDVVATFGPDGITGHPDHIAIGSATSEAFLRFAGSSPGFRRLIHAAIPQSDIERWNHQRAGAGLPPWDPALPFHLRGVPDDTIGITVDTSSVADTAVAAVRSHRTQWSPAAIPTPDHALAGSLRREDWVIAWPDRPPPHPPLKDIFEGL